jgi:hypothetical protein
MAMSVSEVAKLVLFGEASTQTCVLCGVPLCNGEEIVCLLHAGQVNACFEIEAQVVCSGNFLFS